MPVYKIQERDQDDNPQTDICYVEAPSPGVAIEHFLAGHGMLGYDRMLCNTVSPEASDGFTILDTMELIPDALSKMAEYDRHHHWQHWPVCGIQSVLECNESQPGTGVSKEWTTVLKTLGELYKQYCRYNNPNRRIDTEEAMRDLIIAYDRWLG